MRIDLRQLFDIVGERKTFDLSLCFSDEEYNGEHPFQTPVKVSGQIENKAQVVRLVFSVKFVLKLHCDRCMEEFERAYDFSFQHVLVRKLNTDNDEYVVCEDSQLDIDELVRADLFLELPTKVLCKEDCKGLCGQCGKNLNFDSCECEKKSIDPRLEILGKLLE